MLDRVERGARETVAHERGESECEEVGDCQLGEQFAEGFVALIEEPRERRRDMAARR
jgi:hypothetical protein